MGQGNGEREIFKRADLKNVSDGNSGPLQTQGDSLLNSASS